MVLVIFVDVLHPQALILGSQWSREWFSDLRLGQPAGGVGRLIIDRFSLLCALNNPSLRNKVG